MYKISVYQNKLGNMYYMNGRQLTSNFTRLLQKKIFKVDGKTPILIKQSVKNKELNLSLHPINFLFSFFHVSCSD